MKTCFFKENYRVFWIWPAHIVKLEPVFESKCMQVSYTSIRYNFFWWGTSLLQYLPALFIPQCHQLLAFFSLLLVIFRKTSCFNSSYSIITLKTYLWLYGGVIFFAKCSKIVNFLYAFHILNLLFYTHTWSAALLSPISYFWVYSIYWISS